MARVASPSPTSVAGAACAGDKAGFWEFLESYIIGLRVRGLGFRAGFLDFSGWLGVVGLLLHRASDTQRRRVHEGSMPYMWLRLEGMWQSTFMA